MRSPLSAKVLSTLVGSIYDCALDPDRWPETLTQLRRELDFANASMSLIAMPSGDVPLNIMTGPEPVWLQRAGGYGADIIDQWGGPEKILSFPMYEPVVLSRVRQRSEWADNRFFRDWARPQGIHDVMALPLARDSAMIGSLAFGRHDLMGEIGDLEVESATLLVPHLQRAIAIGRLLDIKSVLSSTFDAMLDTLSVAVVLTDADLRILHANAAARALLAAGGQIQSRRGSLTVRPHAVEAALAAALRQAAEDEAKIGRRGFGIPAAGDYGNPCVIHLLPLRHGAVRPDLVPSAVAALFITPAGGPVSSADDALAALFDLTPAETRVFASIASGMTRAEAARRLGIENTTVKAHLSRIFAKTGTRRQADLVALNASIALPVRPPAAVRSPAPWRHGRPTSP